MRTESVSVSCFEFIKYMSALPSPESMPNDLWNLQWRYVFFRDFSSPQGSGLPTGLSRLAVLSGELR